MNKNNLLIIDGTYLAYRSYFATSYASLSSNDNSTGAIVAFFSTFFKLIKNYNIENVFIAFDGKAKTFRHEIYQDYKAGRQKMPSLFYEQLDTIRNILDAAKIYNTHFDGYEADDIIAKACQTYNDENILIFSADQDLNQLVSSNIGIIKKIKGAEVIINEDNFNNYYEFKPCQVIDFKAMTGDSSDNFKGIKGIGPKTAVSLLNTYSNLENIYANIDQIKPAWANKLIEHKDNALFDKNLATLRYDFDLEMPLLDDIALNKIEFNQELQEILTKFDLNQIYKNFKKIALIS
ncbi:hypothetical protein FJO69_01150 [[Mycoplasma] falconis]|uniref:5'-3' exonuclease n=1 Tax=[Mycoplasma] falconis TaxID=92403 RepID=A0A501XB46_9BACT|nr:5'-3' exonuclease H3TH domain-containing protein [[Mycoplasma] falconis]TPE57790.1 hypothetical protein FJO69_01150 [[Mycoplasma] falconis]